MHQIDRPCTHTIDNTLGSTSMPLDRESQCSLQDRLLHKPMFHTTDAYACRLPPRTSSLSSLKQGILIACQIPRRHGSFGSQLNASLLHSCALRAALAQMHSVLTSPEQVAARRLLTSCRSPSCRLPPSSAATAAAQTPARHRSLTLRARMVRPSRL